MKGGERRLLVEDIDEQEIYCRSEIERQYHFPAKGKERKPAKVFYL